MSQNLAYLRKPRRKLLPFDWTNFPQTTADFSNNWLQVFKTPVFSLTRDSRALGKKTQAFGEKTQAFWLQNWSNRYIVTKTTPRYHKHVENKPGVSFQEAKGVTRAAESLSRTPKPWRGNEWKTRKKESGGSRGEKSTQTAPTVNQKGPGPSLGRVTTRQAPRTGSPSPKNQRALAAAPSQRKRQQTKELKSHKVLQGKLRFLSPTT